jgi:hypothetical protein
MASSISTNSSRVDRSSGERRANSSSARIASGPRPSRSSERASRRRAFA